MGAEEALAESQRKQDAGLTSVREKRVFAESKEVIALFPDVEKWRRILE